MNTKMMTEKFKPYAPALLRISLALVFIYFGLNQLINPNNFIGYLPNEVSMLPFEPRTFVILNGAFEMVASILLILGFYTRITSALLGLHLLGITFTIGFTQTGIRDFGLAMSTLAITLFGPDKLCLETFLSKTSNTTAKAKKEY